MLLMCICGLGLGAGAASGGELLSDGERLREGILFAAMFDGSSPQVEFHERDKGNWTSLTQLDRDLPDSRVGSGEQRERGRVAGPTVSDLALRSTGGAQVAGMCAPNQFVLITLDGRNHREVLCGRDGRFVLEMGNVLGAGDHVLAAYEKVGSRDVRSGQDIRVFIPEGYVAGGSGGLPEKFSLNGDDGSGDSAGVSPDVRDYAEDLAHAASERFSQLTIPESGSPSPSGATSDSDTNGDTSVDGGPIELRPDSNPVVSQRQAIYDWATRLSLSVRGWQDRSSQNYYGSVVKRLRGGVASPSENLADGGSKVDIPLPDRAYRVPGFEPVQVNIGAYLTRGREWLEQAHLNYQRRVVRPLSIPDAGNDGRRVALGDGLSQGGKRAQPKRSRDAVTADGRLVVSSPPGRLASADRIAKSDAATQRELERLRRLGATSVGSRKSGGDRVGKRRADPDRKRAELEEKRLSEQRAALLRDEQAKRVQILRAQREEDERRDASVSNRKAKADVLARKERDRRDVLARTNAKATTAGKEKANAASEADRKRKLARERADAARRKAALKVAERKRDDKRGAATKAVVPPPSKKPVVIASNSSTAKAGRVRVPSRKPRVVARELSGVDLPPRATVRRARTRVASGRSGLGAGQVRARVKKRKKARASVRRARVSKKRRRVAVRSYRKRRDRSKKRKVRRRRGARTYVVRPGDTLWAIARRYYGSGKRYKLIQRANRRKIRNPDVIRPRQRLRLPKVK